MSLVSLHFICLTHPPCLHSAFEVFVCVWERQRHYHVLVCTCLMDTLLLSTSLCTAPASTMMPTALIFSCHFIIMSPLFIRPPPRSLSRFLSFILSLLSRASLFYFSNSTNPTTTTTTPLDPFLCLTVPMLVISALSIFFLSVWSQLLNFLSHLRHFAWFRFEPFSPLLQRCSSSFLFLLFCFYLIFLLLAISDFSQPHLSGDCVFWRFFFS